MVDTQVIDDEEDFGRHPLDEPPQEFDKALSVDGALDDLERDFPPVGDGRDHGKLGPASRDFQGRGPARRGKAAYPVGIFLDRRLIAPVEGADMDSGRPGQLPFFHPRLLA